jgi:phosphate uptake regulator
MMRAGYQKQLEGLHTALIHMGALCEEAIACAVRGLLDDDRALREKAAQLERDTDLKEREIEAICVRLLLREQPVASDLRQITAAQRMVTDMERIGDQAADIAFLAEAMYPSGTAGSLGGGAEGESGGNRRQAGAADGTAGSLGGGVEGEGGGDRRQAGATDGAAGSLERGAKGESGGDRRQAGAADGAAGSLEGGAEGESGPPTERKKGKGGLGLIVGGVHIGEMAEAATEMLTACVDSFVAGDLNKAREVVMMDDRVDDLFRKVKGELLTMITEDPQSGGACLDLLMIAKYLERIGDHAVNIAEWVVYSISGDRGKPA